MSEEAGTESPAWHARDPREVLDRLDTSERGLTEDAADERRARYGPNELPQPGVPSPFRIFLRQFRNPLIYILAVAAVVSLAIGEVTDAVFIVIVVVSDAAIGGFQEWHAERSIQALQRLIRTRTAVVREGEVIEVDSREVVPGDVVILEAGTRVPADIRLLSQTGLLLDESTLTGESTSVSKDAEWAGEEPTPVADRRNMAFAGTTVNRGRGRGVVVATGTGSVVGELARDVVAMVGGEPPLVHRMEEFTRSIGLAVLVLAVAAILIGVGFRGIGLAAMFLFAVALMVAAIPEGLPVSMTVALGVSTRRMTRVGVIVRRMVAVEGLGSCTLIATDKTGTLTENELTVRRVRLPSGPAFDVTGQGYEPEGLSSEPMPTGHRRRRRNAATRPPTTAIRTVGVACSSKGLPSASSRCASGRAEPGRPPIEPRPNVPRQRWPVRAIGSWRWRRGHPRVRSIRRRRRPSRPGCRSSASSG